MTNTTSPMKYMPLDRLAELASAELVEGERLTGARLRRWARDGIDGRKLRASRIGKKYLSTMRDLEEFLRGGATEGIEASSHRGIKGEPVDAGGDGDLRARLERAGLTSAARSGGTGGPRGRRA